jgi:hypothetical protein
MKKILSIIILVLVFSSCSTIFTGTSTPITFKSNVPAKVEFDGVEMGQTPYTTKVKRSFNGVVTMRSEGYEAKNFELQKSFSAISILNLGNLLGWVIDLATGSINKFDRQGYEINLEKKK